MQLLTYLHLHAQQTIVIAVIDTPVNIHHRDISASGAPVASTTNNHNVVEGRLQ